jgi:UDP-N-acetylmuramoylalanine--D-glutamate ligase
VSVLEVEGKRVVVVGLGKSGIAACRLLLARGARVVGTDAKKDAGEAASGLASEGVELVLGGHAGARLAEADLVVVSPGVPTFPELAEAEKKGVPVWGEIELAVRALAHPAPIIAIGGTNGKSTTTSLVGALLERAGKRVFVGGNLGEPLAAHADESFDVIVLEVSSFQMERVPSFRPKVAVLLNVSPDHLDRYPSFAAYADAKGNAFARQTAEDLAVVPIEDDTCLGQARRGRAEIVTFGRQADLDVLPHAIVDRSIRVSYERKRLALRGGHNALNAAAAIAAVRPFGLDPRLIAEVLAGFRGLPHRMAFVRRRAGVSYYDDSKGTNVDAAVTAVRGMDEAKVVLVAGGRGKGATYAPLAAALRDRGRAAVLLGEEKEALREAIGDAVAVRVTSSMEEAVEIAAELAQPGDAVLLSPACSSFDMFADYKDRGDAFVRAVQALSGGAEP